jgi:hypothetical protein
LEEINDDHPQRQRQASPLKVDNSENDRVMNDKCSVFSLWSDIAPSGVHLFGYLKDQLQKREYHNQE